MSQGQKVIHKLNASLNASLQAWFSSKILCEILQKLIDDSLHDMGQVLRSTFKLTRGKLKSWTFGLYTAVLIKI